MNLDPRLRVRLVEQTPARGWVIETLEAAARDPMRATSALRTASRDARKLRSRERRALWDVVYALIRGREALAHRVGDSSWGALLDAWLEDPTLPPTLPDSVRLGAPPEVAEDLRQTYVDDFDAWLEASNERAPTFLRVNLPRITREALKTRLEKDEIATRDAGEHGLEVEGRANLLGSAPWREGLFEVQDLASQRVAALVDPEGKSVLDLCAGAGGKALAMAALGGVVTATDIRGRALEELRNRASRARARIDTRKLDGPIASVLSDQTFERVLVDAPCSGTGVWRRHPEFRWRLQPGELEKLGGLQRELIRTGAERVTPGGWLVYATCSALRMENEDVVEGFLAELPDWSRVRPDFRSAPHLDGTDGMYAAVLQKA